MWPHTGTDRLVHGSCSQDHKRGPMQLCVGTFIPLNLCWYLYTFLYPNYTFVHTLILVGTRVGTFVRFSTFIPLLVHLYVCDFQNLPLLVPVLGDLLYFCVRVTRFRQSHLNPSITLPVPGISLSKSVRLWESYSL